MAAAVATTLLKVDHVGSIDAVAGFQLNCANGVCCCCFELCNCGLTSIFY